MDRFARSSNRPRSRGGLVSTLLFVLCCVLGSVPALSLVASPPELESFEPSVRWVAGDGGYWEGQRYLSGDYDGDGRTDIARVWDSNGSTHIDVFRRTGAGMSWTRWANDIDGFWASQSYLAADFDGDGYDDIVRVCDDGGLTSMDVLRSTGGGFVYQRWATRQGVHTADMKFVAGDFDGNGRADVAKIFYDAGTTSIDVFESSGAGFAFYRWITRSGGHWEDLAFTAGDYDGDGRDDIAKLWPMSGKVSVDIFRSQGTTFAGFVTWMSLQGSWVPGSDFLSDDVNGDGLPDLVRADGSPGGLSAEVFVNGVGSFVHHPFQDDPSPATRFVLGDFDHDGKAELAGIFGRLGATHIDVLGVPTPAWEVGGRAVRWATDSGGFRDSQVYLEGDFNGDGEPDVARLWDDEGMTSIDVHTNNRAGFDYSRWATQVGGHWGGMEFATGDFNGDGYDDIVKIFTYTNGTTSMDVYLGSPWGFSYHRWLTDNGGHWAGMKFVAGDFNGDGLDDVAKIFDSGGASIDVYLSAGWGFHPWTHWAVSLGGFWEGQQYVAGDYDGDGRDDIARIFDEGSWTGLDVFTSHGSWFTQYRWATVAHPYDPEQELVAGDFDGDGDEDVVKVHDRGDGRVGMLIFDSHRTSFSVHHFMESKVAYSPQLESVAADFDGDGRAEVANVYGSVSTGASQFDVYGGQTRLDPTKLRMPGDTRVYTPEEAVGNLLGQGFELVASSTLEPGDCTVVYPNADLPTMAADMGLLTCVANIGGEVRALYEPVFGGCDALSASGSCSIGTFEKEITIIGGPVPMNVTIQGPGASACGAVNRDNVCADAGVDLWRTSFMVADSNGNGAGVGAYAGVGVGASASYGGGVLSGSIDIGAGVGFTLDYSVNTGTVIDLGSAGFSYAEEGVDEAITGAGEVVNTVGDAAEDVAGAIGDFAGDVGDVFCGFFGC